MVRDVLRADEVGNLFNAIAGALRIQITLVEVKITPEGSGCLIRSRDFYGRLPDVKISFLQDKESTLDSICICAARLGMAVRFRQELATSFCGCSFFLLASKKKSILVGIRAGDKKIIARGPDPCEAYMELKKAADESMKIA